jgi:lysophospholipase L1-like esterase
MTFPRFASLALACTLAFPAARAQAPSAAGGFFYRDGDTPVVFLGDSITAQRMYTTYLEAYTLGRFPSWNLTFRNIGWGGDTSWLSKRQSFEVGMKRDILALAPKAITIDFGMNDARGGDANYPKYVEHTTRLARELKAAGARVALLTPSPEERYVEGQPGGSAYNLFLKKFSDGVKEVAAKEGTVFVDQFTPFLKVIEDGRKAGVLGAAGEPRLIPDAVHPNMAGHLVMAAAILKGLGAPALVSDLEIDAAKGAVTSARGCKAEVQPGAAGELKFTRVDEALPLYVPPEAEFVLKVPGFNPLDELSLYRLKVTGLAAAKYDLKVDGEPAASLTREQLAAGVNLSLKAGAVTAQARKLFDAVREKNAIYYERWQVIQLYEPPAWLKVPDFVAQQSSELAKRDQAILEKEKEINALRKPLPHTFTLKPSP